MTLAGGAACVVSLIGGWQAAVSIGGLLTVGGRMTARRFDRHRRQATAQIRQSVSSPISTRRNTYFDDLIAAAEAEMAALQESAREAETRVAHAEARLHLARRDVSRLQLALAALPVPTILLDAEGVVFAANAAAGEALPEARPSEPLPPEGPVAVITDAVQQVRSRGEQAEDQVREVSLPAVTRGPAADDRDDRAAAPDEQPAVRTYLATIRPIRGADRVIEAVGAEAHSTSTIVAAAERVKEKTIGNANANHAINMAIRCCRKGGTVSVPGVYTDSIDGFQIGPMMNKSITLTTGQTHVQRYLGPLLQKIESGQIDPSFVITHHVTLDDAPEAYKTFRDKKDGCIKVVINP